MARVGPADVWRRVCEELEDETGVGATRESCKIDHILLSHPLRDLVKAVITTPEGGSDHMEVIAKVCLTVCPKPSNVWRFPSHLLQAEACGSFHRNRKG